MAWYASLPLELVSRIAAMVHNQDRAWSALEVQRADDSEDDGNAKYWAHYYGRGILALVQVDRRTRSAALPFLLENLTTSATADIYFRCNVLGGPLGQLVRHVDCRLGIPDQAVSLACALRWLPNLSSLKLEDKVLLVLSGVLAGDAAEALAHALKGVLGRISSLEIESSEPSDILCALSHVDKRRLRRLRVGTVSSLMPFSEELVAALASLEALVEVELGSLGSEHCAELQERLRLPHVRSLSITCEASEPEMTFEGVLIFAHHIAPSLEVLVMPEVEDFTAVALPIDCPDPLLPTLRALRIDTYGIDALDMFHLDRLPAVEHLHLIVSGSRDEYTFPLPDEADLPSTRTSLRTLVISYEASHPLEPPPWILDVCEQLGIRLVARQRPLPSSVYRNVVSERAGGHGDDDECEADIDNLELLFKWTVERAHWLLQVGDRSGLKELFGAVQRLRERFAIEQS